MGQTLLLCMLLLGFVAGYFFTTGVVIALTIIAISIAVYLFIVCKEMAAMIAMIYTSFMVVGVIVMWVTHLLASDQPWLDNFLKHILR